VLVSKLTPLGRGPDSLNVGAGLPVAVTVNDPGTPTPNVVLFALVIAGALFTTSVAVPETAVELWQLPDCGVAVIVIVELPPGVVLAFVVIVSVDVALPLLVRVSDAGLNEAAAPVGRPDALRSTVHEVPLPLKATVMV
jgi:hypothetical protein